MLPQKFTLVNNSIPSYDIAFEHLPTILQDNCNVFPKILTIVLKILLLAICVIAPPKASLFFNRKNYSTPPFNRLHPGNNTLELISN